VPLQTEPAATVTPAACSPESTNYCVVDAFFVFQIPIAPPGTDTIDRYYPYGGTEGGTRDPHHGVEFYNASGTPVLAAANGTVYFAGNDKSQFFSPWANFYGKLIILKHALPGTPFGTLFTIYAHLSKEDVSTGQSVTTGEKIGEVGSSGSAEGSHLHFEVRYEPNEYTSTLNPELWLVPHPGNGTLAIVVTDNNGKIILQNFNVQYYPDRNNPATKAFDVNSYAPETVNPRNPWWGESATLGDQPAGWYRITFLWAGAWIERWIEIQPGKLTRVAFMVK
jgi:murein DD-endopeptidase MepM/ murein hydrolase activator NlpD